MGLEVSAHLLVGGGGARGDGDGGEVGGDGGEEVRGEDEGGFVI